MEALKTLKDSHAKRFFFYGTDLRIHIFIQVFIEELLQIILLNTREIGEEIRHAPPFWNAGEIDTKNTVTNYIINYLIIVDKCKEV